MKVIDFLMKLLWGDLLFLPLPGAGRENGKRIWNTACAGTAAGMTADFFCIKEVQT